MRQVAAGILGVLLVSGAAPAWAVESSALAELLVKKGIITQAELAQLEGELAKQQEAQEARLKEEVQEAAGIPDWVARTTWKGDIRLRNEHRDRTGTGRDVNRQRIRFRYGFATKVSDELKVKARLATGGTGDPTSTNDTFDDAFDKKPFVLDQAYLTYAPDIAGLTTLNVLGGIMPNPFWRVGPLTWDSDLSFDGMAMQVAQEVGEAATVFGNSGVFLVDSDETEAASLWSVQAGASLQPFAGSEGELLDEMKVTGAFAYHDYKNVANAAKAGTDISARGTPRTSNSAVADFNLINPSVALATKVGDTPVKVYGDWVRNTAGSSERDGYQVGFKVGKAKAPLITALRDGELSSFLEKGWEAGYFFQRLEADAIFDEFADGDFNGGGTNARGNVFAVKLAMLKNSTLGVKYFDTQEINGAKNETDTLQVDWVTKF